MKRLLLSLALLAGAAGAGWPAPLPLVQGGRSEYAICCDAKAPASVQSAAKDLRDYVRKATGADLPIVAKPQPRMICLGDVPAARKAGLSIAGIPLEGFRIATKDEAIYILGPDTPDGQQTPGGGSSSGTRNGACAFLERFLGVRWLMPGAHGDYVPRADTITVPDTDLTDAPFFLNRRLPYIQEKRDETKQWWARQRLGFSLLLSHSHNWDEIGPEEFQKHPDWFALRGGMRVPPAGRYKLCVTNPGLVRAFADAAIVYFNQNPLAACFSLSPSDGGGWCECANCAALYEKDPNGERSVTPAIVTFYNQVAALVAEKHPKKTVAGYVYAAYVFPPSKAIPLRPNLFLVWAPSFDYGFRLYHPDLQKQWDALVAQWRATTENISYYDLPNCVHNGVGAPNPPGLKILKFLYSRLKRAKMKGVYVYGSPAWGHAGPMNYLLARLAWDPDADVDALFNEYCDKAYAEAAGEMKRFYRLLDAETERYFLANKSESYVLTEGRLRDVYAAQFPEMERLYRAAEAKIQDPDARARLQMLGENLTVLHWNLCQLRLIKDPKASSFALGDKEFMAYLKAHEGSLALAEGERARKPAIVSRPLRVAEAPVAAKAEGPKLFTLRGDQRLVLRPTGDGPVEVRFPAVKRRGPLPVCVVYDAKGKEVERQILSVDAPLTLPAAGSPYYLLTFNVGSATFSVEVKGAAWAVEGRMSDEGLHLLGAAPPLYFEVPEGVKTFHLWLAAGPPGETAVATLTTPAGRVAARFDCTQKQIDDQRVEAQAGEAGFWKLTIEKAPTGVLDDVYVKPGKELPGYFSFAPEQALSVRPE